MLIELYSVRLKLTVLVNTFFDSNGLLGLCQYSVVTGNNQAKRGLQEEMLQKPHCDIDESQGTNE